MRLNLAMVSLGRMPWFTLSMSGCSDCESSKSSRASCSIAGDGGRYFAIWGDAFAVAMDLSALCGGFGQLLGCWAEAIGQPSDNSRMSNELTRFTIILSETNRKACEEHFRAAPRIADLRYDGGNRNAPVAPSDSRLHGMLRCGSAF